MAEVTIEEEINRMDELVDNINYLQNNNIAIGIFGGEDAGGDIGVLALARIHEYGVEIEVTEAMRNYLHATGLHLRSDTEQIVIPERSFIRAGFDAKKDEINEQATKLINGVLEGSVDAETAYETLGEVIVGKLQAYLTELSAPPNHPYTVEQKGSSNPLIDSERLRGAITYKVV